MSTRGPAHGAYTFPAGNGEPVKDPEQRYDMIRVQTEEDELGVS